jgi:putrescine aminotransferase
MCATTWARILLQLTRNCADHPLVGDAETCGLMAALLLVKDKVRGTAFADALEVGMVCRGHCFRKG